MMFWMAEANVSHSSWMGVAVVWVVVNSRARSSILCRNAIISALFHSIKILCFGSFDLAGLSFVVMRTAAWSDNQGIAIQRWTSEGLFVRARSSVSVPGCCQGRGLGMCAAIAILCDSHIHSRYEVLGPILFLIYINDIAANINSTIRMFADDCLVYRTITNTEDHLSLQQDLNTLVKWSDSWQMKFNVAKCSIIHVTQNRSKISHNYTMNDEILQTATTHPYHQTWNGILTST